MGSESSGAGAAVEDYVAVFADDVEPVGMGFVVLGDGVVHVVEDGGDVNVEVGYAGDGYVAALGERGGIVDESNFPTDAHGPVVGGVCFTDVDDEELGGVGVFF